MTSPDGVLDRGLFLCSTALRLACFRWLAGWRGHHMYFTAHQHAWRKTHGILYIVSKSKCLRLSLKIVLLLQGCLQSEARFSLILSTARNKFGNIYSTPLPLSDVTLLELCTYTERSST